METPTQANVPGAALPATNVPAGAVPPAVPAQTGQTVANNTAPANFSAPVQSGTVNGVTYIGGVAQSPGNGASQAAAPAAQAAKKQPINSTGQEIPQGFTSFDTSIGKNVTQPEPAKPVEPAPGVTVTVAPNATETAQGATKAPAAEPTQPDAKVPQSPKEVADAIFAKNPNLKSTDFQKEINSSGIAGTPDEMKVWDAYHEYTHSQLGLNKYGASDVNSLASAISNGDLAVGSPTWNAVSAMNPNAAAAKAKYEADLRAKSANELASKLVTGNGGKSVSSTATTGTTLENLSDKITSKVTDPFQIYSLADALSQNPEVLANKQKVLASDAKIDDLTRAKMKNYEDLKKQYPNVPASVLMGMEAKMDKDLDEQIYNEQRDRNYSAGMLSYYSDIAQSQVQARNQIAQEQRQQVYAQEQAKASQAFQVQQQAAQFAQQEKMDKSNFAQSKELAQMGYANQAIQQKAQFAQQEHMANLQNSFDQQGYDVRTAVNSDGQQVTTYTKKGNPRDSMSFDANGVPVSVGGNPIPPRTEKIADSQPVASAALDYKVGQVGGECTKWASDVMNEAGFGRALSTGLRSNEDDTVAFKASKTNTSVPSIGSAIALNNGTKYGHWGIVTGVDSSGRVSYMSSNENGDKKITYGSVKNGDRNVLGYYNPNFTTKAATDTAASTKLEGLADAVMNGTSNLSQFDVKTRTALAPVLQKRVAEIQAQGGDTLYGEMAASAVNDGKMSDTAKTQLKKMSSVVSQLSDLGTLLKSQDSDSTAPLTGWLRSANPWDTDAQTIKATIQATVPNLARGVYGEVGVLTDNDIANYVKTIPNLRQTDDVQKAVMGLTLRAARNGMADSLRIEAANGSDVSKNVSILKAIDSKISSIESELGIGSETAAQPTKTTDDYLKSLGY